MKANINIFRKLKAFLLNTYNNKELLAQFSLKPGSFTRNRKITFCGLVLFILRLNKLSLSIEVENYFNELDKAPCSASAISQYRSKFNPLFFKRWNLYFTTIFYDEMADSIQRYKGYRLVAIDGSKISLNNSQRLLTYFGGQTNQSSIDAQASALYVYDVLNKIILDSSIAPYKVHELTLVYNQIKQDGFLHKDMLLIMDRLFCNFYIFYLLSRKDVGTRFVVRGNETKQLFIKEFIKSGKSSSTYTLYPNNQNILKLKALGYEVSLEDSVDLRLVRVELGKTVEVIVTNLSVEEFEDKEFKELYFKRWGIETKIGFIKNIMQIETFSGDTPVAIEQDFYAHSLASNLYSSVTQEAEKHLDIENKKIGTSHQKKKTKHAKKVNSNKGFAKLRSQLIPLFLQCNEYEILEKLTAYFLKITIPIRKNRTVERKKQVSHKIRSKHKTYSNYKRGF